MNQTPSIALVYDRVNSRGGAEEILKSLHTVVPNAPLYTSVYTKNKLSWIPKSLQIIPSWINHASFLRSRHQLIGWIMPLVFGGMKPNVSKGVLSITSEFAKGVRYSSKHLHISYILTPTRYLWSHENIYMNVVRDRYGILGYALARLLIPILRIIDLWYAQKPTHLVAISNVVAKRIKKYYGRKVMGIIYPPVNTTFFSREKVSTKKSTAPYLLWVGRLVPYKRLDLVVETAKKLRLPLYVAGLGEQQNWIIKQASDNSSIRYLGDVSDAKKRELMGSALCFIQPGEEDFGITPVEAVSMGTPIVIHKNSGAAEVLPEKECGVYVDKEDSDQLIRAIRLLQSRQKKGVYRGKNMHNIARRCDTVIFEQQWKELLCKTMNMC